MWFLTLFNSNRHLKPLSTSPVRKLFIMGEKDQFTSKSSFESFIQSLHPSQTESRIIAAADHFWFGKEADITIEIESCINSLLLLTIEWKLIRFLLLWELGRVWLLAVIEFKHALILARVLCTQEFAKRVINRIVFDLDDHWPSHVEIDPESTQERDPHR